MKWSILLVSSLLGLSGGLLAGQGMPASESAAPTTAADPAPSPTPASEPAEDVSVDSPSGQATVDPGALVVEIRQDGQALVDGTETSDADLDKIFRGAFERDPARRGGRSPWTGQALAGPA